MKTVNVTVEYADIWTTPVASINIVPLGQWAQGYSLFVIKQVKGDVYGNVGYFYEVSKPSSYWVNSPTGKYYVVCNETDTPPTIPTTPVTPTNGSGTPIVNGKTPYTTKPNILPSILIFGGILIAGVIIVTVLSKKKRRK